MDVEITNSTHRHAHIDYGWLYLLEALCDGGDGGHATGQCREHVSVRAHGAVEVPLLLEEWNQRQG